MPTYQYECISCGHQFEQFQSFSDEAIKSCPECEGEVKKVYSAVGVVFKGSGFYKTDSSSAVKTGKSENKSSAKSSGDSSGKKSD
jgi:putative FmdB family regulatory protein